MSVRCALACLCLLFAQVAAAGQQDASFASPAPRAPVTITNGSNVGRAAIVEVFATFDKAGVDLLDPRAPPVAADVGIAGWGPTAYFCEQGTIEAMPWPALVEDMQDFAPGAITPCGLGIMRYAYGLAYAQAHMPQGARVPAGWKDFWDVERWPGPRGMYRGADGNLEFALLADGVAPAEVYAVLSTDDGVRRAFRMLDALRPHIRWYTDSEGVGARLAAGDVAMSTASTASLDITDAGVEFVWRQSSARMNYLVVGKGRANATRTLEFIRRISLVRNQAQMARIEGFGPARLAAYAQIPEQWLAVTPGALHTFDEAFVHDLAFWAEHGERLNERFMAWFEAGPR